MKRTNNAKSIILLIALGSLIGCGPSSSPPSTESSTPATNSVIARTAVMETILADWQSGRSTTAVSNFVAADWSARPLFTNGSALNLTEGEFRARIQSMLDPEAVASMGTNLMAEIDPIKRLAAAVGQEGQQAAAQHDYAKARKYFAALQNFGVALDSTNSLGLLRMVGQGLRKRSEIELGKLPE